MFIMYQNHIYIPKGWNVATCNLKERQCLSIAPQDRSSSDRGLRSSPGGLWPRFWRFFPLCFQIFQNHFHVFSILISLDLGLCNSVFKWLLNVDLHRSLWSCSHVKLGRCLICVVPSLRKEQNEYPWSMRGFITNLCARRCWSENDLKEDQTQVYNLKFVDS